MNVLSRQLGDDRETLLAALRENRISGREFVRRLSDMTDRHLTALAQDTLGASSPVALVALGGYGRRELCPASDIDLMFLLPSGIAGKEAEAKIEKFLYAIWDAGLKVGQSIRTVKDCVNIAREDMTALTSMLDARLLTGPSREFEKMRAALFKARTNGRKKNYVTAKMTERDQRHKRLGDSRYMLEPNIKDGKGGLRDYQTLFWITDVLYGARTTRDLQAMEILTPTEAMKFRKAHDYLLTVRCHLHDVAGRAEERLHFDVQPALAARLGYQDRDNGRAVERFMKHYFLVTRDVGDLTRIVCAVLEAREEKQTGKPGGVHGFSVINGRLGFPAGADLARNAVEMIRLFRVAQETNRDIHPLALREITRNLRSITRAVRQDPQANALFLDILLSTKHAALTLRRMNEAGVLGRFIPEFGQVIALTQFDRYHVFTVDEHTLQAVDILHEIENGALQVAAPLPSKALHAIRNRRALFVAMFLHDICKGRGGDHSLLGAELALRLCPRFGLDDNETRLVSWLVFDHLVMSNFAFKRDLEDPKTIEDFVFRVYAPERLNLLFVLTAADIMAVGPDRWNAWKSRLLGDLYMKAAVGLKGQKSVTGEDIRLPGDYEPGETRIHFEPSPEYQATQVTVFARDRVGLFATLAGGLSAAGANIIEARINTLEDGTVVDSFTIQNLAGRPIDKGWRQDEIRRAVMAALNGTLDIESEIARHKGNSQKKDDIFEIPVRLRVNNRASRTDTVIEIAARDRPGLLYDITRALSEFSLQIRSAKITTMGIKAVDVFYVQDDHGEKTTVPEALRKRIQSL
ncbi:MAG: [protein-PII] uridylyltransferase [Alphaproteobacteria bacterium]|nr:[protein-PII] uridylyltransferase [Alphaproteobacteria bacterium]